MLCPNIIAEKVSGDRQNFCVQKVSFRHNVRALRRPVSDTSEAEALVAQSGEYMRPLGSLKGNTIGSSQARRDESEPIMLIVHVHIFSASGSSGSFSLIHAETCSGQLFIEKMALCLVNTIFTDAASIGAYSSLETERT